MKTYYLCIHLLALLILSAAPVHALPLASAKVLVVKGAATYGEPGSEINELTEGTILSSGDSVVTGETGVVHIIFSNGAGITIKGSSNLVFTRLEQRPFWKNDPSDIPEQEVSKSTTLLELKYGNIRGHVGTLREDSKFGVQTLLGEVLVSGELFFIEIFYNKYKSEYILNAQNINGEVYLKTKFSGSVKFGRGNNVIKQYAPKDEAFQIVRIPPKHSVSIRKSIFSPALRKSKGDLPKSAQSRLAFELENVEPFQSDQEVVSPNGTEGIEP